MSNQHTTNFWTDERVELLKEWWHADLPSSEIAQRLGTTRNAVISKTNRIDCFRSKAFVAAQRARNAETLAKANRAKAQRAVLERHAKAAKELADLQAEEAKAAAEQQAVVEHPHATHFIKAGFDQCRFPLWPMTARTGLVCGAPSDGRSFCAYHRKVCWAGLPRSH